MGCSPNGWSIIRKFRDETNTSTEVLLREFFLGASGAAVALPLAGAARWPTCLWASQIAPQTVHAAARKRMNVGVPILTTLSGPPDTPFSRPTSPNSEIHSPHQVSRPGSPKRPETPKREPLFPAPPGRVMIDELTEQSKLAREAAFELLLARAPLTAAALDRRHEQASVAAATSAHSPNGRRSPARVRALDHAAEYKQERDREAARKAATAKQLQLQEQRLPPRTLSAATFDWKEPNVDEEKGGYAA